MKKKIYLYSKSFFKSFLENVLCGFELIDLNEEVLFLEKLTNKNILIINKTKARINLTNSFLLKNNVLILSLARNNILENEILEKTKTVYAPIATNKFIDEITNFFLLDTKNYKDIRVMSEKIINTKTNKICSLTQTESKILTELIDQKKISKDHVLEKILLLKKDTETRTIESHLTRIRKKLYNIGSELEILSKDNTIFFDNYKR